jgi:hypothetical protein
MSENLNGSGEEVVEEVVAGTETEVVETPEAEVESQEPQTVPYARLSEVVQQREAMRLEAERNAFKLQQLSAAFDAQQAELARLRPAPAQQQGQNPWDTYTDPNAKALAQLIDGVVSHRLGSTNQELQKLQVLTDNFEATNFWSNYPKVTAEVKEAANRVYATAKAQGMNIDRQTALVFARGEMEMAKDNANLSAATTSTTQQAQVNRTARAAISTPGATPGTRPTTQPVKSASDFLRQIEADMNKPRR